MKTIFSLEVRRDFHFTQFEHEPQKQGQKNVKGTSKQKTIIIGIKNNINNVILQHVQQAPVTAQLRPVTQHYGATQLPARDESSSCFHFGREALWPCQRGWGGISTTQALLFTCKHIFDGRYRKIKKTGAFRTNRLYQTGLQEIRFFFWRDAFCLMSVVHASFYLYFYFST